ncbi:glycoside hydrolase family 7 protein [Athelia psychrophila]|uniref:Glucanase n=1 Tax=Athelia psychrophila TaxID=1759441 RepID=A0A166MJK4_9AGAM|nr:glycoside hydrolase family 7 protein [Fibularhizoctonia sp. CBS 109695]
MFPAATLLALSFLAAGRAQQVGTQLAEVHPPLTWETCTASGACTAQAGQVVLDANWRWVHSTTGYTDCFVGNTWDATLCPDPVTCAYNCALDGADYSGTYGVTSSGNALKLEFLTTNTQVNLGSRLYLMASDTDYEIFKPLNMELSFDVDVSDLPCGFNGALYFSEMSADGGLAAYAGNKAGAKYGTGYCDSQCPRDLKFINGVANTVGFTSNSATSGTGSLGSCCSEMDIWEANSISAAFTPHPCSVTGQTKCTGAACGSPGGYGGVCDPDGCDFNSYRMGSTGFYGPGKTVDTTKPFTVVTQFITSDNTSTGTLAAIKRLYVQNGVVIQNSQSTIAGVTGNDITAAFCDAQKTAFGDTNDFDTKGGLPVMGESLGRGAVLVLSIWDDYDTGMLWLDSDYPANASATVPGVARGTCAITSGVPATPEIGPDGPTPSVTYSNIKFGPIGSTGKTSPGVTK